MDLEKNYYKILLLEPGFTDQELKKNYYKLSKLHHPDKGGDGELFSLINEANAVFGDKAQKKIWESRSRWGKNYKTGSEFRNASTTPQKDDFDPDKWNKIKLEKDLNIHLTVGEDFNGSVEYQRWVCCKKCKGSGLDLEAKIVIKDKNGKILKQFQSEDGCDFCEGTGKNPGGLDCFFCGGMGKTGTMMCKKCAGVKRILGKQKLTKIVFPEDQKVLKVESMGNVSTSGSGRCGHLYLVREKVEGLSVDPNTTDEIKV